MIRIFEIKVGKKTKRNRDRANEINDRKNVRHAREGYRLPRAYCCSIPVLRFLLLPQAISTVIL